VHDFAYVAKNIRLTQLAITNALMFDLRSPVVTGLWGKGVIKPRAPRAKPKNAPHNQIYLLGRIPLILHRLCCFQALCGPSYYF
jgi:hypothetical protein